MLPLDGRLGVVPLPTRPLVPAEGLDVVVGLEAVVGLVVVACGRTVPPLWLEVLPLTLAVGRWVPLIEPAVVLPETVAPFCGLLPETWWLIEPVVPLLPCLTLAT